MKLARNAYSFFFFRPSETFGKGTQLVARGFQLFLRCFALGDVVTERSNADDLPVQSPQRRVGPLHQAALTGARLDFVLQVDGDFAGGSTSSKISLTFSFSSSGRNISIPVAPDGLLAFPVGESQQVVVAKRNITVHVSHHGNHLYVGQCIAKPPLTFAQRLLRVFVIQG